jgi:SAM-dependent methyltransferase
MPRSVKTCQVVTLTSPVVRFLMTSAADWNARYAAHQFWSGEVNPTLAMFAGPMEAGAALDLGCGEGADAVWLASRGWKVRGVDFSRAALDRAETAAHERNVGSRCEWIQADLSVWTTNRSYDLVTCHYLHEEPGVRMRAWRSAAAAVAPGGSLLIVGHSPDEAHGAHEPAREDRFDEDEIASTLALDSDWAVDISTIQRPHDDVAAPGHRDIVLFATRTGA